MTRTLLLATAAFVVLASGAPGTSFAADGIKSDKILRQIKVEPKSLVADPIGTASPSDAGSTVTGVQQIVIDPTGSAAGNTNNNPQVPAIATNPSGSASDNNPIGPIDVADSTPVEPNTPEAGPAPQPEIEQAPAPSTGEATPATPDTDLGATEQAPAATDNSVAGATALYNLLNARGYKVEILKNDGYGRYVFRLTRNGDYSAHLLLVDGASGEVVERRDYRTADYDNGYSAPTHSYSRHYTPAYTPTYDEGCDEDYGYQASNY